MEWITSLPLRCTNESQWITFCCDKPVPLRMDASIPVCSLDDWHLHWAEQNRPLSVVCLYGSWDGGTKSESIPSLRHLFTWVIKSPCITWCTLKSNPPPPPRSWWSRSLHCLCDVPMNLSGSPFVEWITSLPWRCTNESQWITFCCDKPVPLRMDASIPVCALDDWHLHWAEQNRPLSVVCLYGSWDGGTKSESTYVYNAYIFT